MQTLQDLKYAARSLRLARGFTAVVVLTLALGIGANVSIFSIVNAVVLRPLPYPKPEQLVRITSELRKLNATDTGTAAQELFDYQSRTDLFSGVAGLYPVNANVTGGGRPERVDVLLVSWNYFSILGVAPALGRVFGPQDNGPGIPTVAVVSHAYWRDHLDADPNAIGKTLTIDGDPFVLVGVMPAGFRHPGWTVQSDVDLWAPAGYRSMPFGPPNRRSRFLNGCLARLRPGVTAAQAATSLAAYGAEVSRAYPADYPARNGWAPLLIPLQQDLVGSVTAPMVILLGGVSLVLLIVCANVAHLVLARASGRVQEIAIRKALGASAGRLARQMLTESAVLAVAGGALGLLLSAWGIRGLVALAPSRVPRLAEVSLDGTAVAVAALLAIVTTVLFGLAPALQIRRLDAFAVVKEGGRGRTAGARRSRVRGVLVAAEVALATVLLVGAGLLIRSVGALLDVPVGFDTNHLLTARVWLPRPNDSARGVYLDPERRVEFYREVVGRLDTIPGVERAAMSSQIPMGGYNPPVFIEPESGSMSGQDVRPVIQYFQVSPGYFATLGIPLLRGRTFDARDRAGAEQVVVISDAAARAFWKGENAVGKRLRFSPRAPWMTVIGVTADVRNRRLTEVPQPILYRSLEQSSNLSLALLLRTRAGASGVGAAIQRQVSAVDPDLPVYAVRPMNDLISGAVAQREFLMRLLVVFGGVATGLALLGIYGVIAYSVSQRTREIGIRVAVGARASDVSWMVVRQGFALTAVGIAAGVTAAMGASQLIRSQLFHVQPSDPRTLTAVLGVMVVVTLAAAYLPARRAARVDPMVALRNE